MGDDAGCPLAPFLQEAPRISVNFDDQIFSFQVVGGISRYFVQLMRAYRAADDLGVDVDCARLWTRNAHLLGAGMGHRLPGPLGRHGRVTAMINRRLHHPTAADVVHHTFYDRKYLTRRNKARLRAVTIYDMIPEMHPQLFPKGNPHLHKRAFVDAADVIFCISNSTKRDLIEVYGIPGVPVVVTPLGVDPRFAPRRSKPNLLPDCYVLYVGDRGGYKDFGVLLRAFGRADMPGEVQLVAVGGGPLRASERDALLRSGISERFRQVDLNDDELAGAYAHALCFAFPSRYEGFGLPTLEAMASGCPAVLARSSAHPEVGGDAALYFKPGDHDELAGVISRVATDPDVRQHHLLAGLAQASGFSWSNTARLTGAAYRDVLAAHGR